MADGMETASEAAKRLLAAQAKTCMGDGQPWVWEDLKVEDAGTEDEYVYIPQGSHLGGCDAVALDNNSYDTYGEDAYYLQVAANVGPVVAKALLETETKRDAAMAEGARLAGERIAYKVQRDLLVETMRQVDTSRLRLLADFNDRLDDEHFAATGVRRGTEVQDDLRRWADAIESALSNVSEPKRRQPLMAHREFQVGEMAERWENLRVFLDTNRTALLEMSAPGTGHIVDRWVVVQMELERLPGFVEAHSRILTRNEAAAKADTTVLSLISGLHENCTSNHCAPGTVVCPKRGLP